MKEDVPSKTALIVAIIVILAGSADETLVPPGAIAVQVQLMKNLVNQEYKLPPFWILTHVLFAPFVRFLTNLLVIPKFLDGIGFRKIFMDSSVRTFLTTHNSNNHQNNNSRTNGAAQVLVVAGGYDTLTYRLAQEFPSIHMFEVDHPATGEVKREALGKMSLSLSNLHLVSADLTKTKLQDVLLTQKDYDASKPTICILEGLLYYLEEVHVKELLTDLAEVVGPNSQIALDHFSKDEDGNIDNGWMTGIQSFMVKKMGEKYIWAIHPSKLKAFTDVRLGVSWSKCLEWE